MRKQDHKVALIQVEEGGALEKSSEFMRTCHDMNIIVQTTDGYAYSINSKMESPNKTLYNITRELILN